MNPSSKHSPFVMSRNWPYLLYAGLALGCFLIVGSTLYAFYHYFSVMPVFDTLGIVKVLDRSVFPISRWEYMLQEHNEHRIFLTKAVLLFDYYFLDGQKWLPRIVILLFNGFCFLVFLKSYRHSQLDKWWSSIRLLCLVALFWGLFQLRNFDCVFQLQFLVVNFGAAVTCYHLARWDQEKEGNAWFVSVLIFAFMTAFNMGNGLFLPIVLVIASVLLRQELKVTGVLILLSVFTVYVYFRGYSAPPSQPLPREGFKTVVDAFVYFVFFIGNLFWVEFPHYVEVWFFGVIGILLGMWILVDTFFVRKHRSTQTLFYALIVAFVFASVIAVAHGRLVEGSPQALNGRYSSTGVLYWAAIISWLFRSNASVSGLKRWMWSVFLCLFFSFIVLKQIKWCRYAVEEGTRRRLADISLMGGFTDLETIHIGYYYYQKNWIQILRERELALFSKRNRSVQYAPVALSDYKPGVGDFEVTGSHDFGIDAKLQGVIYYGTFAGKNPSSKTFRIADQNGMIVGFGCTTIYPEHIKIPYRDSNANVHWKAYLHGNRHDMKTLRFLIKNKQYRVEESG